MSKPAAVMAIGLSRRYRAGGQKVNAVDNVSLSVARGEVVAIMGPSGSGKSTLLYLLAGLEEPDEGRVLVTGVDWRSLRGGARARFRRRACGFIAQGLALLPQATAVENVEVPLVLTGMKRAERHALAISALQRVGLSSELAKLPDQLSGGQQQRVAIARALVTKPAIVLADEPTGSLDSATARSVIELLVEAAAEQGTAVVFVTHDPVIGAYADRIVPMHSGRTDSPTPASSLQGGRS